MFKFDNSFAREMAGFYQPATPQPVPAPRLLRLNHELAAELGLGEMPESDLAAMFAGNSAIPGAEPLAQAYAGHQFGGFSPSLGDGRALLLGEVIDSQGQRRDIAFKGSGRTPYSRGGDGKAAVGPMLREYLIGEAMHGLGIPTTRALAVVATGELVYRDQALPGAVLTRVAASHLRIGTMQFFAARDELDKLRQIADYAIARHDPQLAGDYLGWLKAVAERQARLIAQWMSVGFIHGVMNTDNAALSGESIDFGPCAFMEAYDPATVYSSIDKNGRYAYRSQPLAIQWNLARLAEAILPLMGEEAFDDARAVIEQFASLYKHHWLARMRAKLGLEGEQDGDLQLVEDWLALLQTANADFTLSFRGLADVVEGSASPLHALEGFAAWSSRWNARRSASAEAMRRINPLYIARNHLVEAALTAAWQNDDMAPFERLLTVLKKPFEEHAGFEDLARPAPAGFSEGYRTFCGT
ncbi:MAG TPA: YdiU family protein [Burkholderiaceae bacterium]|jgi:uncharacterized protein YdiU (UPF0061 family)